MLKGADWIKEKERSFYYIQPSLLNQKKLHELVFEDQRFENKDIKAKPLQKGSYTECTFVRYNFENSTLSGFEFIDCTFNHCNLALAVVNDTRFKNVKFEDCKMSGIDFSTCNDFLFEVHCINCMLDYASFYQKKMMKAIFSGCSLLEVDLTDTNLSGAIFKNCNLLRTTFNRTNLEKADLSTATNFSIDPENNRVKNAKFSLQGLPGLLGRYQIKIV